MENQEAQIAHEISQRIQQLSAMSGEDLKNEMSQLKTALLANPAACLLIKDEDVGLLVTSLRKALNIAVASAAAAKTKPKKEKTAARKLSAEELAAALEEM